VLARHGIRLRADVIADRPRSIIAHLPAQPRSTETTAVLDRALDEIEHRLRTDKRAQARGMV
jgi:NTE family protein